MRRKKFLDKKDFVEIITEHAPELQAIFEYCEPVWDKFVVDLNAASQKYQIELYLNNGNSTFFSGYIFFMEKDNLSKYTVDSVYDKSKRRKRIKRVEPALEWTKNIKKGA